MGRDKPVINYERIASTQFSNPILLKIFSRIVYPLVNNLNIWRVLSNSKLSVGNIFIFPEIYFRYAAPASKDDLAEGVKIEVEYTSSGWDNDGPYISNTFILTKDEPFKSAYQRQLNSDIEKHCRALGISYLCQFRCREAF